MTRKYAPTSVRLDLELKAQLAEIKRKTAVIEFKLIGRMSSDAGKGIEDVLATGAEAELRKIAEVWTPEHERLLRSLPPPSTLRGSRSARVQTWIVADSREQGFGPGTPQEGKIAEAVRLHDQGVPNAMIGELFGVSGERVRQWLQREAAKAAVVPRNGSEGKLGRARSRSRTAAP